VRTAAICGLAAAIGAIFQTPVGGGIFAVEIMQRKSMGYRDLFPAILSSATAAFLSWILGLGTDYAFSVPHAFMEVRMIGWLVALSVLVGLMGGLYTRMYAFIRRLIRRERGRVLLKVVIGTLIASSIAWAINPALMGTSKSLLHAVFLGNDGLLFGRLPQRFSPGWMMIALFFIKALCNCITVVSGMSAGFTGPAVIMGSLLGAGFTTLIGIPRAGPTYYAFIAGALTAIVGFQVNRHFTLYDFALAGSGRKTDTSI